MAIIQTLSPHLADLIAAGEVVERPASAVKELVENALDAGATDILTEIQHGGMRLLRVTDNGSGMSAEDAKTAFLRHATSKLRTEDDLGRIGTLGFRGEALAAISAVSRIDLLTRCAADGDGISLHLEAGTVTEESPAGCPKGTTIIVRDLFFNTPARMKFMKHDSAEAAACFSAVQHQALAHPEVSFRFLRDGEEVLHTAGDGDLLGTIYSVMGRQSASEMVSVSSSWENCSLSGYVTKPTATRGNRNYQHFFVNGRYIKSRALSTALEEAYRNQMMQGRFPACVLHLTIPVTAVDVNVHPAKTEVKFLSEKDIFDCVHYGVLGALNVTPGKPEMRLPSTPADAGAARPNTAVPEKNPDFFRTMPASELSAFLSETQDPASQGRLRPTSEKTRPAASVPVVSVPVLPSSRPVPPMPAAVPASAPPAAPAPAPSAVPTPSPTPAAFPVSVSARTGSAKPAEDLPPEQIAFPMPEVPWRIVGEVLNTYIIVEQGESVLFIDKHAAHERILFEKLRREPETVMPQTLLEPISAELNREEAAVVLESAAFLARYGYEIEDFGSGSVLIRQIPSDVNPADAAASLAECAEALLEGKLLPAEEKRDRVLHTIACKSAIKANWITDPAEIRALVTEVLSRDDIKYCPHGRPVCITLTGNQLAHQFKRS